MDDKKYWFHEGLRFECIWDKCFACCTGSPGYVWLVGDEPDKIAEFLNISKQEFLKKYTFKHGTRISLKEKLKSLRSYYDCVFLDRVNGCQIYPVRPVQCITYPFWKEIVASKEAWDEEAEFCPGMNQGPLKTQAEIIEMMGKKPPPITE